MNKLDTHTYSLFEEELAEARASFMTMAGLVETQLKDSVRALAELDTGLADAVQSREGAIDSMELDIEQSCTQILALRAPTARDLRLVLGILRGIRELERIADEAKKIAGIVIELAKSSSSVTVAKESRHLSKGAHRMVSEALDSFGRLDTEKALQVIDSDEELDEDYASAIRELITHMMEDPRNITRSISVLWILRSLERIGDHAKNICEAVVYIAEGKDIRHGNFSGNTES